MGVVDRWTKKLAERRKQEAAALRAYRQVRESRRAAERVIKRHKDSGAKLALAYGQKWVGTRESPAGSNRGKQIDVWQREVDMIAQPWCGAFVHACLKVGGVKGLSSRMRYCPYIIEDGTKGLNGLLKRVPLSEAKPGDLLVYQFDTGAVDHVGLFVAHGKAGQVLTIEGNTSAGESGSQSNGGMVANRTRNTSLIAAVIRPRYPA